MRLETPLAARRLLKVAEAAEVLGISRSKAYQMARAGDLPGVLQLGGSLRVDPKALEEWIDAARLDRAG